MDLKITEMRDYKTEEFFFPNIGATDFEDEIQHYLSLHMNLRYMDIGRNTESIVISHLCELITTGATEISGSREVVASLRIEIIH